MTDMFGNYRSQTTIGLQRIDSSKYPDTNKDFENNVRRLNSFVDYISQYLQQMQKGVDDANKDPISKMRDMVWDLGALLGGGELLYGIDLGDLQYFLPAIAALFGFDADQPFPINLLYAAEHFLLGYIIPLDSWNFAVQDIIDGWIVAFGLDDDFRAAVDKLLTNLGRFTNALLEIFNDATGFLGVFDIFDTVAGPVGPIWGAFSALLGNFNTANLGAIADPFLGTLRPWIDALADLIGYVDDFLEAVDAGLGGGAGTLLNPLNWLNDLLGMFGGFLGLGSGSPSILDPENIPVLGPLISAFLGGSTDLGGIVNLGSIFTNFTNLLSIAFDPLEAWGDIITGALNPLELIQDVLARSWLDEIRDGMEAVLRRVPFAGSLLASVWNALTDFVNFADDTELATVQTRESIVTNITGNTAVDPATSEIDSAIAGQTDSLAAQAAAIAALQQVQTGNSGGGISAVEQFEYIDLDSLEPTLWERTVLTGTNITNGTIAVADGHNAGMVAGSVAAAYEEWDLYVGPNRHTRTPYQRIGMTIAVRMSTGSQFTHIDIYGRASDDKTKWCRFTWKANGVVQLWYKNGGAITQLGTDATGQGVPSVGSNLWMDCGTTGGINVYRLYNGTKIIKTVTDTGHVIDETQLGAGWGQFNNFNNLPGKITQWSIADNQVPTVVGTTFRAYRGTATGISKSSGEAVFPANTFDTVDYISSDLVWDASQCKITATKPGTYLVGMRIGLSTVIGQNEQWNTALFKNGTLVSRGEGWIGHEETSTANDNENRLSFAGGGMMSVYLNGTTDYIQFGFNNGSSKSVVGDTGGVKTWVTATRIGLMAA